MIQQSLRPSKSDRSLRAERTSRFGFALQPACDPQCPWLSRTTWRYDPFHQAMAYTEIETSEIVRLFQVTAFQSRMELPEISRRFARFELFQDRPDGDLA